MEALDTFDNVADVMFDLDLPAGATLTGKVFATTKGMPAASVELTVTPLGATPVNLTMLVLGQNSAPATETTRLLPLDMDLPNTSAIAANYAKMILLSVYSRYIQLEFTNNSGGAVHVKAVALGTDATRAGAPPAVAAGAATTVQLIAGAADAGTFHLATGAIVALATAAQTALDASATFLGTLAGAVASGNVKAILQTGANAIGKLAANSGVIIGDVNVVALPALVLAAGAAAIGKLAANAGINIGTVDVAVYTPFIDTVASADTSAHAYATSQVVKAPAFARVARTTTGTVTISDGTHTGMALSAGDSMPVYVTNLNTISYQFSVNAATEKFSISAGV